MGLKIDGHRHTLLPEAVALGSKLDPVRSTLIYPKGLNPRSLEINRERDRVWDRKMIDVQENISDLNAAGMDLGVLQPTQTMLFYWAEPAVAGELSRMVNEHTARQVRENPGKVVGLATVPLQDVDLAVSELTYAVRELGLHGVVTGSNVNGLGFDEEAFQPFFKAVEALDVPIFIHPNNPPGTERTPNYYLTNFLGYTLETTMAAAKFVFGGVLERYPGLKICLSHAGGTLPFLLGRLERGRIMRPETGALCPHPFAYYLKNFYVDTITHRADILRFVLEVMPPGHVIMGTDYPYDMAETDPVGFVKSAVADEKVQEQIFGGNIAKILRI
jgi:aminocarboxymuconate-semialdehyde decarboxylase